MSGRRILVTGATGKVGMNTLPRLLEQGDRVRALCHHRMMSATPGVEVVTGSISDRNTSREAMSGVTHVVHLATCKETPDDIMDVAVKGLFWLLEEARQSTTLRQFILLGGDAAVGHMYYRRDTPVTEATAHRAYPGCYALSKVLEEVMLEQYLAQYNLNTTCLRASWIMEKDDLRYSMSFGEDVFGGPRWRDLVGAKAADRYFAEGAVPCMLDADGRPARRNFVHVKDVTAAILSVLDNPAAGGETFNISMTEPLDHGWVCAYLKQTRGLSGVPVATDAHSVVLDNSKARRTLGWQPQYDVERLVAEAWDFERPLDEPRIVAYPG